MSDEPLYGGVPLWHEDIQPAQVPVAGVDAREICKALQACQVVDSPHLCPESPEMHVQVRGPSLGSAAFRTCQRLLRHSHTCNGLFLGV